MAVNVHHRLCDWNIVHDPDYCVCGACRPKAPWFDAYVRLALRQATYFKVSDVSSSYAEEAAEPALSQSAA